MQASDSESEDPHEKAKIDKRSMVIYFMISNFCRGYYDSKDDEKCRRVGRMMKCLPLYGNIRQFELYIDNKFS